MNIVRLSFYYRTKDLLAALCRSITVPLVIALIMALDVNVGLMETVQAMPTLNFEFAHNVSAALSSFNALSQIVESRSNNQQMKSYR